MKKEVISGMYNENENVEKLFFKFEEDDEKFVLKVVDTNGVIISRGVVLSINKSNYIVNIHAGFNDSIGIKLNKFLSFYSSSPIIDKMKDEIEYLEESLENIEENQEMKILQGEFLNLQCRNTELQIENEDLKKQLSSCQDKLGTDILKDIKTILGV